MRGRALRRLSGLSLLPARSFGRGRRLSAGVKRCGPLLESAHDPAHGLIEDNPDDRLQGTRAEFEIDEEIDLAFRLRDRVELPVIVERAKRALQIFDIDPELLRPERHPADKALAKDLERDDEIGLDDLALWRLFPQIG